MSLEGECKDPFLGSRKSPHCSSAGRQSHVSGLRSCGCLKDLNQEHCLAPQTYLASGTQVQECSQENIRQVHSSPALLCPLKQQGRGTTCCICADNCHQRAGKIHTPGSVPSNSETNEQERQKINQIHVSSHLVGAL